MRLESKKTRSSAANREKGSRKNIGIPNEYVPPQKPGSTIKKTHTA
jgi:hypothetical protein